MMKIVRPMPRRGGGCHGGGIMGELNMGGGGMLPYGGGIPPVGGGGGEKAPRGSTGPWPGGGCSVICGNAKARGALGQTDWMIDGSCRV